MQRKATLSVEKEVMAEHENGVLVSDLASKYGMSKSTISPSLKNKEMIKAANVAKGPKSVNQSIKFISRSTCTKMNKKC